MAEGATTGMATGMAAVAKRKVHLGQFFTPPAIARLRGGAVGRRDGGCAHMPCFSADGRVAFRLTIATGSATIAPNTPLRRGNPQSHGCWQQAKEARPIRYHRAWFNPRVSCRGHYGDE